jgi:hypothetical protein
MVHLNKKVWLRRSIIASRTAVEVSESELLVDWLF